jgi:UDP-N-acetylmuramate dehydrogenase
VSELRAIEEAARLLGERAERAVRLGPLTTYRVGGPAALFTEVRDEAELEAVARAVEQTGVPVLVVGKGSNLLVAESGFPGLALRLGEEFAGYRALSDTVVEAGGGLAYPVLARRSAAAGLTGMEWAVGIPGSVGGGVRMNAGGHGSETRERLLDAVVVDLSGGGGEARTWSSDELAFTYRHSAIEPVHVVVSARFELAAGDPVESSLQISEIVRWRRENQPGGQNAGSVFTNPPGDSAGRLIDEAGLKGLRLGTATVSDKHANFIQADVGGSADDVRRLIEHVRSVVTDRTGIELSIEVRLVG